MSNIEKGSLSINSENIFPIIKKWLYSDRDIFLRELVSNACDAITKLKKLDGVGEWKVPKNNKFRVDIITDSEAKTLTIVDNGIGMTGAEVKEYINQIAFSGAKSFLEQYKDKTGEEQIIGHFGLGFYSVFMVSKRVTIDTLSYKDGEKPVHWTSDSGVDFTMEEGDRKNRGTKITLFLNDDCYEFANEYRVKEVLEKYCSFMPVEIYYTNANAAKEEKKDEKTEEKKEEPINETHPIWSKNPTEVKEDEYKEFYRKVFRDYKEPLFYIHLNMDYPFNLKGILYFPKINTEYEAIEGTIKLYNNQVFIADNIKEVIPEFLLLLKGVIDCPDLPLNVSRSALQNDGFVKKISDYITKKVADKLSGLCKTERENYEKYWDDISPFIKYGCLRDSKFEEKIKDYLLFKDLNDKYVTVEDYIKTLKPEKEEVEEIPEEEPKKEHKEDETSKTEEKKPKKIIYYVTDPVEQSQYINMFKENGLNAVILTHKIDSPFINSLEAKNEDIMFRRIDSKVAVENGDVPKEELNKMTESLSNLFKKALSNEKLELSVESLNSSISSMITISEEGRRMEEMMKQYGMGNMGDNPFSANEKLVLNCNNNLVKYLLSHNNEKDDTVKLVCEQLYDLASIANKPLEPDKMTRFIARSNEILNRIVE